MVAFHVKRAQTTLTQQAWDELFERVQELYQTTGKRKAELMITALSRGVELMQIEQEVEVAVKRRQCAFCSAPSAGSCDNCDKLACEAHLSTGVMRATGEAAFCQACMPR